MTTEQFRQALQEAVRGATSVSYHKNMTPEQVRTAESLYPLIEDDSEWSKFIGQIAMEWIDEQIREFAERIKK